MKTSRFWQLIAVLAVVGLFLNAAGQFRTQAAIPGAMLPALDLFTSTADAQPLVEQFTEQQHDFLAVWNTDDAGDLHYRILRWEKGALRSTTQPELVQHIKLTTDGRKIVLVADSRPVAG